MLLYAANKGAAKGYFKAALDTGFTQMLLTEAPDDSPIYGPESTVYWQEHYDPGTGFIRQDLPIDARSAHWFFCKLL